MGFLYKSDLRISTPGKHMLIILFNQLKWFFLFVQSLKQFVSRAMSLEFDVCHSLWKPVYYSQDLMTGMGATGRRAS